MKTLVLCIDRDNDLGRKTGIESPVVGRDKSLKAAETLALADPEESDVNCMFSAINTYDQLEKEKEIAIVCGSTNVGPNSDTIIARQLDKVLKEVQPGSVIVVTDGEEDEYILPIIQSRVKVDALKRVVVRQSETLEGTYYLISRFMEDEKMQRKFMLPIALVLFVWGVSALVGSPAWGFASVMLVLGAYLLAKVFHIEGFVTQLGRQIYAGLRSGRISLFVNLLGLFIVVIAVIAAYNVITNLSPEPDGILEYTIRFLDQVVWWFVLSLLISITGRFIDIYFKEKRIMWNYVILPFSLVAFGLIFSASTNMLIKILYHSEPLQSLLTIPFLTLVTIGILLAFIGTVVYHIAEGIYGDEKEEKH